MLSVVQNYSKNSIKLEKNLLEGTIKLRMTTNWRMSDLGKWKKTFAQISSCKGKTSKTNGAIKIAALRNASICSFLQKKAITPKTVALQI